MGSTTLGLFVLASVLGLVVTHPNNPSIAIKARIAARDDAYDMKMHPKIRMSNKMSDLTRNKVHTESETSYWIENAQASLKASIKKRLNTNVAKNVILFLGDGLSVPTIMAARTYLGQLQGQTGEESKLSWEDFPYSGFSKTYCVDSQVPDSACTATAYLCGVKTNLGTIGVNANATFNKCESQMDKSSHVTSIAEWAQNKGKSVGIVTTARVTHASPAGAYAKVADRDWESDYSVVQDGYDPNSCVDIATQLVTQTPGKDFEVILGGGRRSFLPRYVVDNEGSLGVRLDGVNLIERWKREKASRTSKYEYIWNRESLQRIIEKPNDYDYVLGLFEASHCAYHKDAPESTEPTLAEMTEAAIKVLQRNDNGFFLFVEGGRIDHAHHGSYANLALDETVEFAKAVEVARKLTSEDDTLIVVTADHAHTMSVSGYSARGNDILGVSDGIAEDSLKYTTLSYANGPGYKPSSRNGDRYDISNDEISNSHYQYPAAIPLSVETHGGDDVGIFSNGPWSHLFSGTLDEHNIPHFMAYAACIGDGLTACDG